MRIIEDLHTHTYFSHGKSSPRANVLRAIELGMEAVAISEHAGGNMYYGVRGRKLDLLNAELGRLRHEFKDKIIVKTGLECNVTDFGKSDIPADRSGYDVIILGYHKGIPPVNRFSLHILSESFGGKSTPRRNAESILAAAEAGHADIISHPNEYLKVDIPYLADGARQLGLLLEINSAHVSLSHDEIRTIHEHGAGLIIGSDAHVSHRVGDFAAAIDAAEKAGVLDAVVNLRRD
ncbi:MAG: PHP domain-containing protein [Christensenellaceae bacterium]|nr:PHP domain-containing protein [Christensenellaceae bacterium]